MHKPNTPIIDGFDEKLRDEFAGRAMAAIISKSNLDIGTYEQMNDKIEISCRGAYHYADAMLEARKEVK